MYNLEILQNPYASEDLEAIRTINQENIPEVSDIESIERLKQLIEEGIIFKTNSHVGKNIKVSDLQKDFDALFISSKSSFIRLALTTR